MMESKYDMVDFSSGKIVFFRWKNNENWPVEYVSPSVKEIFGYEVDDFVSGKIVFSDLIHPEDVEKVTEEVRYASTHNEKEFSHAGYRLRDAQGNYRHVFDHSSVIRDQHGKITHYEGYISDETSILEQNERLELVLAGTGLGLWDWNPQTNDVTFDERWANMLGYTLSEITPSLEAWESRVHPDDIAGCFEDITAHMEGKTEFYSNVHRMMHKDGKWRYILDRGKIASRDDEGNVTRFTGTHTDITHLKETELELQKAKEKAELASHFKSRFLANMSHEIRTPMNAILGFVEQLEKSETDPERLKQFKVIHDSGQSLLTIINDILDFSKIESGKMSLENRPLNLNQLLEESMEMYTSLAMENDVRLNVSIDPTIPKCILGDQTRLKQVIFNLISNAIKFTPNKGSVTLESKFNSDKNSIYIAVADTGIGISEDKLNHIFESFAQEDASTTRKFGGTGLGLSISQRIVSLMGGVLQVNSKQDQGSKFYFEIAVEICEEEKLTNSDEHVFDESLDINGNILVAEDNKTNQLLMSVILDNFDVTYEIANDGQEAVELFKKSHFDLILMDENMPNMNGIEATASIRKLESTRGNKRVPIIAVTANALAEDKKRYLDAGMDSYVSKPYSEEDIKQVLIKFLDN